MSQMHSFILNPSLVLRLFTMQTHLPSIKPINNRYITQHSYKIFPPPPTQNTIIFNCMIITTMIKLQCELKIQIWYRKSVPIIHFSTCEGHYFLYQKYIKIPHTSNITSMAHKFYSSKCFQVVPPNY